MEDASNKGLPIYPDLPDYSDYTPGFSFLFTSLQVVVTGVVTYMYQHIATVMTAKYIAATVIVHNINSPIA